MESTRAELIDLILLQWLERSIMTKQRKHSATSYPSGKRQSVTTNGLPGQTPLQFFYVTVTVAVAVVYVYVYVYVVVVISSRWERSEAFETPP